MIRIFTMLVQVWLIKIYHALIKSEYAPWQDPFHYAVSLILALQGYTAMILPENPKGLSDVNWGCVLQTQFQLSRANMN